MKKIAVLTSGGDSPGMNAAVEQLFVQQFTMKLKFMVCIMVTKDC